MKKNTYFVGRVAEFIKKKGWFFGHFADNEQLKSELVEVAWQNISNKSTSPQDKHYHTSSVEINIVIEGKISLTINGERKSLSKGDFYIIWPDTVVEGISTQDNTELIVVRAPSIDDKVLV